MFARILPSLSLAALLLTGCASIPGLVPPDVTLVSVTFEDLTVFESSGILTVRVANENDEPVLIDGGVYNLYLNGAKVGKALSDARFEVPRLSSATAEVEVFINNLALGTRIMEIIETGAVDYRLKGKFYLDRSGRRRAVRFLQDGLYDFRPADLAETSEPADSPAPVAGGDSAGTRQGRRP